MVTLGPWIKGGMCREISLQSDNNVHCENLIRRALIRADETLSHFSPGWEPRTLRLRLQSNCCCTFSPFLLGRTILRNSYCTLELFCWGHILPGPCGEEHFAGWQKRQGGHMAAGCSGRGSGGKSAKNEPASLISDPAWWSAPFTCYLQYSN